MGNFIDRAGQRFGNLVALEIAERKNGRIYWKCQCDCKNIKIVNVNELVNGHTQSCGICNYRRGVVDHTGKILGTWKVIEPTKEKMKVNGIYWKLKCIKCGNEIIKSSSLLSRNSIEFCPCDIIGEKCGRLTVLSFVEKIKKTNGYAGSDYIYLCQCSCDNKTIIEVKRSNLLSGNVLSCDCLMREAVIKRNIENNPTKKLEYGEAAFNKLFYIYKRGAKIRGLVFDLNKEFFRIITKQKCYYCGSEPSQISTAGKSKEGKKVNTGDYIYNGIDRWDNSNGYVEDNCVPCCGICNHMKGTMSGEEFFNHINQINKHQESKSLETQLFLFTPKRYQNLSIEE
jgi:hypothetical protein